MYNKHIIYILLFILLYICNINAQSTYHRYQVIGSIGYSNPFHLQKNSHHFKGPGISGSAGVHLYFNAFSGVALSAGRDYHSSTSMFNAFLKEKYLVNNLALSRPGWTNLSFLGGPVFKLRKQKFEIEAFGQIGIHVIKVPYLDFRVLMNNEMYEIAKLSGGVEQIRLAWQSGFNAHYRINTNTTAMFRSAVQSNLGLSKYNQLFSYRDVSDENNNNKIEIGEYIASPLIDEASLNNFLHLNVSVGVSYSFGLKNAQSETSDFSDYNSIDTKQELTVKQTDSLSSPSDAAFKTPSKKVTEININEDTTTNAKEGFISHKHLDSIKYTDQELNNNTSEKDITYKPSPSYRDTTALVRLQLITENTQNNEKKSLSNNQNNPKNALVYKIQIAALKTSQKNIVLSGLTIPVEVEYHADINLYKYIAGNFTTEDEALITLMEIRSLGFRDAFIAIYHQEKRMSTSHHK